MSNDRNIPANANGAAVTFTVKIDGQAIPRTFEVFALTVSKEVNRIPSAKVVLIDGDVAKETFLASSDALFIPGKEIELFVGHQAQEDLVFKGVIVKHGISIRRGSSQLKIECRDKAFKMTIGRQSHYYKDVKDSDVVSDLARKYSLKADTEDTNPKHPELVQYDVSDWDFMLSRADLNGKLLLINDGTISAKSPDYNQTPVLTLQYGATIKEFDAEIDARHQYTAVKAQTWDFANQELVEVDAQEPKVKVNGNLQPKQMADVHGLKAYTLRHSGKLQQQELQTWANACWQKSRMAFCRGRVKFDGFAKIKPGDLVKLQGVGDRFNGNVFVSGVRHDVADGIWTTDVQFGMEPEWAIQRFAPGPGAGSQLPSVQGLYVGVVSQLEKDPEGEDRILVKIPVIDKAEEGTWARVACLDAGDKRGSFFRPEVGDEVLVGFINNDPRDAAVLGMLNSKAKPAPLQAADDNKEKGFFFKSKMKILFNDEDKSMTFETQAGNKIVLSEKDKGILLQDQNGNKLMLNKDGITLESSKKLILKASSGDIEIEGMNVKQKASAQFKAEGSAGIEISSSAIAVLKGSMVQIN